MWLHTLEFMNQDGDKDQNLGHIWKVLFYRSSKKVISLRNISKVFSHFYYALMVYV